MLLPGLADVCDGFVAIERETGLVVGAAGVTQSVRPQSPRGPGVGLHVIEPARGKGIGRQLLSAIESVASARAAEAIFAAHRVELGTVAESDWIRLGFSSHETVETQRLPLAQFEPRLGPLLGRMHDRIPASARIIPLYRANLPGVLTLHLDCMGGDRGDVYRRLRGDGTGAFHPRYSKVLTVDGRIVGCILAHRKDQETAIVDADIVAPAFRGGWANVWLKLEATRGALRLGIKNFEYTSFDHYADTRSFTRKLGGTTVKTTALMIKRLLPNQVKS